jgi:hypothetical protein
MATVSLAKPGTAGTAVLQIVKSPSGVVATMALKLQACDITYTQDVEDTTGGTDSIADTFHTAEGSGLLGGQVAFQGLLISVKGPTVEGSSTSYSGLGNMFSTDDTYSRMRWSVQLASGIYLKGSMIVESTKFRWVRTAATVQMTIVGRITDTSRTTTEATSAHA